MSRVPGDVIAALNACHSLVCQFVDSELDYAGFRAGMASVMGPLDPLDCALEVLDERRRREARFYSEWLGGEFGEHAERIPRRADWRYGESTEPYGWVDVEEYRRRLRTAFEEASWTRGEGR